MMLGIVVLTLETSLDKFSGSKGIHIMSQNELILPSKVVYTKFPPQQSGSPHTNVQKDSNNEIKVISSDKN